MESEALGNFVKIGLEVPKSHCYQRYGIPAPEGDEEILSVPAAPEIPSGPPVAKGGEKPEGEEDEEAEKGDAAAMKAVASLPAAPGTEMIQQELDNLTQAANVEAQEYLGKMLAPVADLIESGESLEVIKDKLLSLYSRIDTRSLEVLLGQVRIMANLRGRVNG
jgi:phage gp29-like protein